MPFKSIIQLPDEPILITTYEGEVTAAVIQEGVTEAAKFMANMEGKIYRIIDLSQIATGSFVEVIKLMDSQLQGSAGTSTDPRLGAMVLIATDSMVRLFADVMRKRSGGLQLPIFSSLEDGIAAVRVMVENDRKQDAG